VRQNILTILRDACCQPVLWLPRVSDDCLLLFTTIWAVPLQAWSVWCPTGGIHPHYAPVVLAADSWQFFRSSFKTLPQASIRWRDVWPGALLTAVLFWSVDM
jgi:uncharacterized BrkB/YihY/UPF0761 family membrane protein